MSQSLICDWYASNVKILHGELIEIKTSSRPIQGTTLAASMIHEALQPLKEVDEVYLIGSVLPQGIKADPSHWKVASPVSPHEPNPLRATCCVALQS